MNDNDLIFKPCKNCQAKDYDNSEQTEDYDTDIKTGKTIIEPEFCDKCRFELMMSESNLFH